MPATTSAVVPTYNRAKPVASLIHSILSQLQPVHEIIVWDDGSTDETSTILDELAQILAGAKNNPELPAFRCFKSERDGKSNVSTLAAEKAQGHTVWLCGDEGHAAPDVLATLAQRMENDPDLVAVYGRPKIGTDTEKSLEVWPNINEGSILRHVLEGNFLRPGPLLIRKDVWLKLGNGNDTPTDSFDGLITRLACAGPIELIDSINMTCAGVADDLADAALPTHDALPVAMFEAMYRSEDRALVHRAALLQRACVFGRRDAWDDAMRDLIDAAKIAPSERLSPVEKEICRRAVSGQNGCASFWASANRKKLRSVAGFSVSGASIAHNIIKGISAGGPTAKLHAAAINTIAIAQGRGEKPGVLTERKTLPLSAYRVI